MPIFVLTQQLAVVGRLILDLAQVPSERGNNSNDRCQDIVISHFRSMVFVRYEHSRQQTMHKYGFQQQTTIHQRPKKLPHCRQNDASKVTRPTTEQLLTAKSNLTSQTQEYTTVTTTYQNRAHQSDHVANDQRANEKYDHFELGQLHVTMTPVNENGRQGETN
jgi:hypothetical protein